MKKLLLSLFVAAACSLSSQARYITVSNNPGMLAMFTNLQMAIDSAKSGDTVFVMPSSVITSSSTGATSNYGDITINKPIFLLGEGYRQPNGNVLPICTIGNITNSFYYDMNTKIRGILCRNLNLSFNYYNVEISDCLIIDGLTMYRGLIHNCRIYGLIQVGYNSSISGEPSNKVEVSNCIIGSSDKSGIIYSYYSTFKNNIIFGDIRTSKNLTFQNNIFPLTGTGDEGIYGSENVVGFKNVVSSGTNYNNSYPKPTQLFAFETGGDFNDYQISYYSTSFKSRFLLTAINAAALIGTDGTEVGIYGGMYPWNKLKIDDGKIGLPIVSKFEIIETSIEKDKALKVNFKAVYGKK